MTLSKTESVIFLYIEKRRLLLYEVSPFGVLFLLQILSSKCNLAVVCKDGYGGNAFNIHYFSCKLALFL